MRTAARIFIRIVLMLILLAVGFAIGFPLGRQTGFLTGSEWAMVQAAIAAREAGVSMPVTFEEGQMHVVVKQPQDLYRRARARAAPEAVNAGIVRREERQEEPEQQRTID